MLQSEGQRPMTIEEMFWLTSHEKEDVVWQRKDRVIKGIDGLHAQCS